MEFNRDSRRRRRPIRRAFTLLEIVVVVTIIALLAALVAPRLLGQVGQQKTKLARAEVKSIAQQVQLWMVNAGISTLPEDFDLMALTEGAAATLKAEDLLDPWDRPYVLVNPGEVNRDYDIVSYGADGEKGGTEENQDVVN